jgi:hypothetical protein
MLIYFLPFNFSRNILVNKRLIIWHERLNIWHICTLGVQIIFAAKECRKRILLCYIHVSHKERVLMMVYNTQNY